MAINKNSEYVINFVKNRKQNLISVFDNKCCICGFNSYPEALDFHHVNPEEKEFPLSSNVMKSLEKQLKEAKKCILVCANCHRGIHAGYIEIPKNYKDFFNQERANELISINEEIKYLNTLEVNNVSINFRSTSSEGSISTLNKSNNLVSDSSVISCPNNSII